MVLRVLGGMLEGLPVVSNAHNYGCDECWGLELKIFKRV